MSEHHLITGNEAGKPLLACGTPWEDGVTSGEPAAASRHLQPFSCADCGSRCPHCAAPPQGRHHRDCAHPSAAGRRHAAPAPSGPRFAWEASGTPADILAAVENQPEDNPVNTLARQLLVKAMGRHHRQGDTYQVSVSGTAGEGRPLALNLEVTGT